MVEMVITNAKMKMRLQMSVNLCKHSLCFYSTSRKGSSCGAFAGSITSETMATYTHYTYHSDLSETTIAILLRFRFTTPTTLMPTYPISPHPAHASPSCHQTQS